MLGSISPPQKHIFAELVKNVWSMSNVPLVFSHDYFIWQWFNTMADVVSMCFILFSSRCEHFSSGLPRLTQILVTYGRQTRVESPHLVPGRLDLSGCHCLGAIGHYHVEISHESCFSLCFGRFLNPS